MLLLNMIRNEYHQHFISFQIFIGDALNGVINENFDIISQDIIPLVERALQRLLKRISSKILENFTYDQIFPL